MADEKEKHEKERNEKIDTLKEFGTTNLPPRQADRIQVLPIIGQIEGHMVLSPQTKATRYEHLIPQLIALETSKEVEGVFIILNTVGGDVEAGLAIAEMIQSLSKPTVSLVIGGGHSIGVPLATSADYSFISPTATMIVHPIIEFIVRTSKISKEKLKEFMLQSDELLNDMGTILIGKQAVESGIINEVGGVKEALDKLNNLIDEKQKP